MSDQSQVIDQFVQRLIEEKNFHDLDQEILDQIAQDLSERIEEGINAAILDNLPSEKLEEFSALLDVANEDKIQEFCRANIKDLDEVIARALLNFRDTYLNA